MKRKCNYCINELEEYNSTMCDKCIGSFHRTARKMKFKNIQPIKVESKLNLEEN